MPTWQGKLPRWLFTCTVTILEFCMRKDGWNSLIERTRASECIFNDSSMEEESRGSEAGRGREGEREGESGRLCPLCWG